MKLDVSKSLRTAKNVITANSPVLLVGTAVVGVVTTGVLAAKGGYKARAIIDEEEARRAELETSTQLTLPEKVQLTWLCYAAPAITGASSIAAVVGVHTIHNKRNAALAGLFAVTSNKLDDYQEKAEELLGVKKSQQVRDEMAQKGIDDGEPFDDNEVIITGHGTELCRDDGLGRYVLSSLPAIEAAVNDLNRELLKNDANLNYIYDSLGLSPVEMGETLGWSAGEMVEAKFGNGRLSQDGRPVISFWFSPAPAPQYDCS